MAKSEFDVIADYFSRLENPKSWLTLGVGDDAAVITPQADQQLLVSVDTSNVDVHFPRDTAAQDIGYKSLAVNLSDMAAMGAEPAWFTLAVSLPEVDESWLTDFCRGLHELVERFHLTLVGGDTTRGCLSITIQIAGHAPLHQVIKRQGAMDGDDVYVSGNPGDAAAGLMIQQARWPAHQPEAEVLVQKFNRPTPRVDLGVALRPIATAAIDISDGLAGDLGHILTASGVGAEIYPEQLPISSALLAQPCSVEQRCELALFGGDDYELCFTAPQTQRAALADLSSQLAVPLTRIGRIIAERGLFTIRQDQRSVLEAKGYDHFA